jgi:hypothetical protein
MNWPPTGPWPDVFWALGIALAFIAAGKMLTRDQGDERDLERDD